MSTGRETVERMFAVVDGQRWDEFPDVMTDDVVMTSPFGVLTGPLEWAEFSRGFAAGVPDGKHTVTHSVENGSAVAIEGTWTGTHLGTLVGPQGEIPASGATVQLRFAALGEIRDGKMAWVNVYLDPLSFLTQLGAVSAPA
jgi:ketosteroid isomerase-like protein